MIADVRMSNELWKILADSLGHDVANVYKMILGHGDAKISRLLSGVGEKIMMRHDEFLRGLLIRHPEMVDLKALHNLIVTALNTQHENTPATAEEFQDLPMHKDVKDIQAGWRISAREYVTVKHQNWSMVYFPDGLYRIYKDGKEVASGKYDGVIADSYNTQMNREDRDENLTRDLVSWVEKAIKGKVTD